MKIEFTLPTLAVHDTIVSEILTETGDAETGDVLIQMAAFGEVRNG
jgi:hypothetical protein